MAKKTKKEEVIVETKQAVESAIPQELIDLNKKFDEKIDSDDTAAVEIKDEVKDEVKKEVKTSEEKMPEEKKAAEEETEITGEEKEAEVKKEVKEEVKTAEEKEIEAEAEILEKQILAEGAKKTEAKVKDEKKTESEGEPFECGLDPEEYDEGLIESVNKLGRTFTEKNKVLEDENKALKILISQQNAQKHTEWLDSKINSLGQDFKDVLGEGEIEDIEPGSVQFENRVKLSKRIGLIAQTYQKLGKSLPSRNKLFDQAVSYLFNKEKNKSKTEAETKAKLQARARQVIGSGSGRGSTLSAAEKVLQLQRQFDEKIDEE